LGGTQEEKVEGRALKQAYPSKEAVWASAPRRRTGERGRALPRTACMQHCAHQNRMGPPKTGDSPNLCNLLQRNFYIRE